MAFNNGMRNGQSHAKPVFLGGDKRLEQVVQLRRVDARSLVDHTDQDTFALNPGTDDDWLGADIRVGIGLDRIAHQVQQNLFDLQAVSFQYRIVGVQIKIETDIVVNRLLIQKAGDLDAGLVDRKADALKLGATDKTAHPFDDFGGAFGLSRNQLHRAGHLRQLGNLALVQAAEGAVTVIDDGRQRLVDFVGQFGGHFADRQQARHVSHLQLLAFGLFFRLAFEGNVAGDDRVILNLHIFGPVAVGNDLTDLGDTAGVSGRVERNAAVPGAIECRMLQGRFYQRMQNILRKHLIHVEHGQVLTFGTEGAVGRFVHVGELQGAVIAEQNQVGRGFDHPCEASRGLLGQFALGDIPRYTDDFNGLAVIITDGSAGGFQPDIVTITVLKAVHVGVHAASVTHRVGSFFQVVGIIGVEQIVTRGADNFIGPIAQHALYGRIDIDKGPLGCRGMARNHVGGLFGQQAITIRLLQAALQFLLQWLHAFSLSFLPSERAQSYDFRSSCVIRENTYHEVTGRNQINRGWLPEALVERNL